MENRLDPLDIAVEWEPPRKMPLQQMMWNTSDFVPACAQLHIYINIVN